MLLLGLAACGGPPAAIIGVDGVSTRAVDVPGTHLLPIYVATSRAASDNPHLLFSGERSDDVSYARLVVSVPPDRPVGEVTRASTLPPDPRRHFVVVAAQVFGSEADFVSSLNRDLMERPAPRRHVLLFVHGFNTDFPSAVTRTAQFAYDSGYPGIPLLFSWPSRGRTIDYVYDMNSALQSRDSLLATADALKESKAVAVDILAHSMGNLLVVESMRQMALLGRFATADRIGSIMLAAPDIDIDLFRKQLAPLPVGDPPIFVMTSANDRALALSRSIAGGVSRAGNTDPEKLAELGVNAVDVTRVTQGDRLQHSTFAQAPEVVQLIGRYLGNDGNLAEDNDDNPIEGVRNVLFEVTLLPARIVGGGRVVVVNE
ncbi:alpha/beta hydrolase [Acuticoccus kandeliae]|uniref:alpha/beta hydrolase n=1 Tax=Acuticoccus kandeliae TaxID=2073160 RepID=UPI0013006838|nr:alpha/beta hydrolase [Acuticoccus kandeliae]